MLTDCFFFLVWQPNEGNQPVQRGRREPSNYSAERDRPSEEAVRIKENQDAKVGWKRNLLCKNLSVWLWYFRVYHICRVMGERINVSQIPSQILVSPFSSTNVVIILNKNIHYCLFSWYFTSLWQDFKFQTSFNRKNSVRLVNTKRRSAPRN